jgi:hypothetical protein
MFVGAAYVQIQTFGMNLKGTETRSVEVAHGAIETLQQEGVVSSEFDQERIFDLSLAIKQPIEDQIFQTQSDYTWTSSWMAVLGVVLLVVTWFPNRKSKDAE